MKLTKGKIRKLYNKKKQTLKKKKINKRKSPNKNITFRSKRELNLYRKSLKRLRNKKYKGGVIEASKEVDEKHTEDPKAENIEQPVTNEANVENTKNLDESSLNESPAENKGFENEQIQETPSGFTGVISNPPELEDSESPSVTEESEPVPAPEVGSSSVTEESEPVLDPELDSSSVSEESEPVPTPEPESPAVSEESEPVIAPEPDLSSVSEESEPVIAPAPEPEPSSVSEESEPVPAPVLAAEPEEPLSSDNKLTESINTVVDIISDKIAEKLAVNIGDKSGEGVQNGFISVSNAAETMASKGGQFKKTRKFRLIKNKNAKTHGQK